MGNNENTARFDLDSFDVVTSALRELVNAYPGLAEGDEIAFATLEADSGKAMFPADGAVIETERRYITGDRELICLYPFTVVHRAVKLSENRKAGVKEWLDNLGRWLELQPVTVGGEEVRLEGYPELTGNRRFLSIERQTPAVLSSVEENGAENWVIVIIARYKHDIYKYS